MTEITLQYNNATRNNDTKMILIVYNDRDNTTMVQVVNTGRDNTTEVFCSTIPTYLMEICQTNRIFCLTIPSCSTLC